MVRAYKILRSEAYDRNTILHVLKSYLDIELQSRFCKNRSRAAVLDYRVDFLNPELFVYLFYEMFILAEYYFACDKLNPRIIDCGSNIGISVLFFKTIFPASSITCYEPDMQSYSWLVQNIEQNGLGSVLAHNVAVCGTDGEKPFYFDSACPGCLSMGLYDHKARGESRLIRTVRLSSTVNEPVDLLKLDVEGAELEVMKDLDGAGKLGFIDKIFLEYHHYMNGSRSDLSELLKIIESNGFKFYISATSYNPYQMNRIQPMMIYAHRQG